jgi:hypothetical protein
MKEFKIEGKVIECENGDWVLETDKNIYSADLLTGLDEIFVNNNAELLAHNDDIEIIIRVKNR